MAKVVLQPTGKMPDRQRQKYMTRHLSADGEGFEVSTRDAKLLRRMGWASDPAPAAPTPVSRRRGRPPKQQSASESAPASDHQPDDELEGKSNAELRAMAEAEGIELPVGYVRNDELITRLRGLV